jgi:hypothetical protein
VIVFGAMHQSGAQSSAVFIPILQKHIDVTVKACQSPTKLRGTVIARLSLSTKVGTS